MTLNPEGTRKNYFYSTLGSFLEFPFGYFHLFSINLTALLKFQLVNRTNKGSIPQPLGCESSALTTRPRLLSKPWNYLFFTFLLVILSKCLHET